MLQGQKCHKYIPIGDFHRHRARPGILVTEEEDQKDKILMLSSSQ